jgi:hypothetical protein
MVALKIDVYCNLLRKNDPRITGVFSGLQGSQKGDTLQSHYSIGQALQGNTRDTGIEVNLGEFYTLRGEVDEEYMCYDCLHSNRSLSEPDWIRDL